MAIRVDASPQLGLGHVSRCLSLAEELQRRGSRVVLLTAEGLGCLTARAEAVGCDVLTLQSDRSTSSSPSDDDWEIADADRTREALAAAQLRPRWIVTDSYRISARWHGLFRHSGAAILCIDELADRHLDCDVLVDPTLAAEREGVVPPSCRQLLGPSFAILAPEYVDLRRRGRSPPAGAPRIVISFGGSRDEPGTLAAAQAISRLPGGLACGADIVMARDHSDRVAVEELASVDRRITVTDMVPSLALLTSAASIAVGGAGGSAWERLCLGVPSVLVPIAENQRSTADALSAAGIAWSIDPRVLDLAGELAVAITRILVGDIVLAIDEGQRLCDGQGAGRVADAISFGCVADKASLDAPAPEACP